MTQDIYDYVWRSAPVTLELAKSPLFKPVSQTLGLEERTRLIYERARAYCAVYGLTIDDVLHLSPKFWRLQTDLLSTMDAGAYVLITIQYNLFIGTVAAFLSTRPELRPILERALRFDISAQFMLTEVGHGLDSRNLETTATLLPNGDFELHSPTPSAAKCMPPSSPRGGLPVVAVVMARLVVEDQDCGVYPFLVPLGNGEEMCTGVTSKVFPPRAGTTAHPIDHGLTLFDRVRLPKSALLRHPGKAKSNRNQFFSAIQRVAAGTLFLSSISVPVLKIAVFNAGRFSMRRLVTGHDGKPIPIMNFRTQQLPILHGIAQYHVLQAYLIDAAMIFKDHSIDPRVRHGIATAFKAVAMHHFQKSIRAISEGCGWHGFYEHNQLLQLELTFRGVATAEGDTRVLAIRLASELLIGRYQMPPPRDPSSAIARHEAAVFAEARDRLSKFGGDHRNELFNRDVLSLSLPLIMAVGYRLAFEAGREAGIEADLLALYESGVIKEDAAWYAEQGGISRRAQDEMEARAVDALLPHLGRLVEETGAEPYSTAPMSSEASWDHFVSELDTFSGDAGFELIDDRPRAQL